MFDLFGMEKVNAKESLSSMARGVTLGLVDSFEIKLDEKNRELERLRDQFSFFNKRLEDLRSVIANHQARLGDSEQLKSAYEICNELIEGSK